MTKLQSMEELLTESLNPRGLRERYGLPHPLHKFALNGSVKDNTYADVVLEFLHSWNPKEPNSSVHKAAEWFLFDSEQAFFLVCSECGIDADKLRNYLLQCQRLGWKEMGRRLEQQGA